SYSPFEWLPFGGGARRCIGMAFALYEMKLVLGALFRRFRFNKADDKVPQTRRKHITIAPSGGVRAVLSPRGGADV
ncbi:cytochrome P450, partial [Myxococcota bacterium]|nr:cytochrome P450 [Myxococcota bacterium]